MPTYTDIENTGAPVVPDLSDDSDRETCLAETVWSHRLAEPSDPTNPIDD
ncbi:MAG: hypothetical protein ABEJ88_00340 [Halobacterium sp.]